MSAAAHVGLAGGLHCQRLTVADGQDVYAAKQVMLALRESVVMLDDGDLVTVTLKLPLASCCQCCH